MKSSSSSSNLQYPLSSLRLSRSDLSLHPRLPVTSILPSIFPSIPSFRRQVLRKSFFFFLLFVGCSSPLWLFVTLLHFSLDRSNWSSPSCSNITFQNFPGTFRIVQVSAQYTAIFQMYHFTSFFPKFKFNLMVKRVFFLLKAAKLLHFVSCEKSYLLLALSQIWLQNALLHRSKLYLSAEFP